MSKFNLGLLILVFTVGLVHAEKEKFKYKKPAKIDFESLLIEGEKKQPDISVVTGNVGADDSGLLSLRENFHDLMTEEAGEKLQ